MYRERERYRPKELYADPSMGKMENNMSGFDTSCHNPATFHSHIQLVIFHDMLNRS